MNIQARLSGKPMKSCVCTSCRCMAFFVEGAVSKRFGVSLFVCRFCAIREHQSIVYQIADSIGTLCDEHGYDLSE